METKPFCVSEMIALLQKCLENFGDIPVGAYPADYCYELAKTEDMMSVSLRVMSAYGGSSADNLPGIDLEDGSDSLGEKFLTIFYNDR